MATTTTNFGWDIPQSTDLVKDGATAIAALGQDIDTALVDLKGGTTGQVLAKASNTDLDYSWTTPEIGDITAVTAGTGLTGGGTTGSVSLAFDQANYGGGQYAAGKNKIINGAFNVWQRGTSFTLVNAATYTADRFVFERNGSGYTGTISQQTFTPGTAPVAGYENPFFWRYNVTVAGTGNTFAVLDQRIEDVRQLAGQTATFSFWAKADSARTVNIESYQVYGSGGSATTAAGITGSASVTTSWQRFTYTATINSISGKTVGTNSYLYLRLLMPTGVTETIDLWGVQLEAGSTATPFQTASGGSPQAELAMCQRYYYRSTYQVTARQGAGFIDSTTTAILAIPFPVSMRTRPTALEQSGTAGDYTIAVGGSNVVCTSVPTHLSAFTEAGSIVLTASGLTVGQGALLRPANTNAYLGWSAEL